MATYRKVEIVEAEKYEGPPLTVIHDHLGEQKAQPGDWLLGTERGKIRVVTARQFEAEYQPYSDEEPGRKKAAAVPVAVATDKREISEFNALIADMNLAQENLHAEIADMRVSKQNLEAALDDSLDKIAALKKQIAALKKDSEANSVPLREHPVSHSKTVAKKK